MQSKSKSKGNTVKKDLPFNEELHRKTLSYWKLMRCWNGLDQDPSMHVGKALALIRKTQSELNPTRPLSMQLGVIKDKIISFGSKSTQMKCKRTVVEKIAAHITVL